MTEGVIYSVIVSRVCEHCADREKEAHPYGVHDANGKYMEWEDCWNGCDDGYLSLYDEDPLFYDEDDQEVCDICDGKGGWWVCPVAYHHQKLEEPTP